MLSIHPAIHPSLATGAVVADDTDQRRQLAAAAGAVSFCILWPHHITRSPMRVRVRSRRQGGGGGRVDCSLQCLAASGAAWLAFAGSQVTTGSPSLLAARSDTQAPAGDAATLSQAGPLVGCLSLPTPFAG